MGNDNDNVSERSLATSPNMSAEVKVLGMARSRSSSQDWISVVITEWGERFPEFDPEAIGIIGRIWRLSRILEREVAVTYQEYGLRVSAFSILATLRRARPPYELSPGDLSRGLLFTSPATSYQLGKLEARGLVTRASDPKDGRAARVRLTTKGRLLVEEVLLRQADTTRQLLSYHREDQRQMLATILREFLISLGDVPGEPEGGDVS